MFFGIPLASAVLGSFTDGTGSFPTLANYLTILNRPVYVDGLWFSLWLAVAPTALAAIVGVPLAALLIGKFPGKRFFSATYKIPLVVPSIVAAFVVLVLLDRGGLAHRWAGLVGVQLPRLVRDDWGVGIILASAWKNIPFVALIVSGAMAGIPQDLFRAARTLGAPRWIVFFRIQLPLALPGITAALLLVFITSLGAYAIPNLLGPAYPLPLSLHMYEAGFRQADWPLAYAMGTLLSVAAIAVLLLYYQLTRRAQESLSGGRAE
jgi:putative spermidine/putrescine transport system permease protein